MTDWLERLLKQAAEPPVNGDAVAPTLAKSLNGKSILPEGSRPQPGATEGLDGPSPLSAGTETALTAGELAAGLLREELRLGTPTSPASAEGGNWLAEPDPSPIREEGGAPLPALLTSPDITQIDRAFERDARRYDGTFSLY